MLQCYRGRLWAARTTAEPVRCEGDLSQRVFNYMLRASAFTVTHDAGSAMAIPHQLDWRMQGSTAALTPLASWVQTVNPRSPAHRTLVAFGQTWFGLAQD